MNEVEAVARAIAPSRWEVMDHYLAQTKKKYAGENAAYDPDNFKDRESMATAQAAIAALDAVRGDADPVAWRYVRKPEEWPPANPVVQSTRWLPDDPARPFWIEQPLYAHPTRGDQVARVVEWLRNGGGTDISQLSGSTQMLFLKGMNRYADAIERGEPFNG